MCGVYYFFYFLWVEGSSPAGDKNFFFRGGGEENLFKKVGYKKVGITRNFFFYFFRVGGLDSFSGHSTCRLCPFLIYTHI
jgi:hypothetical protein